ncbi:MAG TPA: preprotein translocase subunit YajC [Bacteroidia bacterium]|jgi:preprotein translocase subunit YajC|nr:preprotein translocase subunit YajC [Bacteroidia bacterium]
MLNQILLMGPPAAGAGAGGGQSTIFNLGFILLIFVVFYFFMIRPQMKKQKAAAKFKEEIKKGDKVITIGGIHAKIAEIGDKTFIIEVEGGVRLKIEKSAVSMENTMAIQKNPS